MNIDELLDTWGRTKPIAMSNIGIAEHFFRKHFVHLQTSPEGYARALDALNKPIPWKTLNDFERSMMTDIIETTGLYAAAADRALCRTKRPAMSDWKTNIKKAVDPLRGTPGMHAVMTAALASALAPNEKLAVCKIAKASDWLSFSKRTDVFALLPPQEDMRLAQLPSTATLELDAYKDLAKMCCPQMYSMLDSLLSDADWMSRTALTSAATRFTPRRKPSERFPLPEDLTP